MKLTSTAAPSPSPLSRTVSATASRDRQELRRRPARRRGGSSSWRPERPGLGAGQQRFVDHLRHRRELGADAPVRQARRGRAMAAKPSRPSQASSATGPASTQPGEPVDRASPAAAPLDGARGEPRPDPTCPAEATPASRRASRHGAQVLKGTPASRSSRSGQREAAFLQFESAAPTVRRPARARRQKAPRERSSASSTLVKPPLRRRVAISLRAERRVELGLVDQDWIHHLKGWRSRPPEPVNGMLARSNARRRIADLAHLAGGLVRTALTDETPGKTPRSPGSALTAIGNDIELALGTVVANIQTSVAPYSRNNAAILRASATQASRLPVSAG